MRDKISIQQIADEAGVSTATVSRVINFPEKVNPQTKTKVETIIRKYHYQPNLLAKGLRNNSMPIVGVMVPDITNEFFASIVIHLQQYLFERRFWTIICNSNKSIVLQQSYLKMLVDQNISGLVFISHDNTSLTLPTHIPIVFIDRYPIELEKKGYAIIESDNYQGGFAATEELIRQGCQKIAFITTSVGVHAFTERMRGYCDALHKYDLTLDDELILKMDRVSKEAGAEAVMRLLRSQTKFDGIFAAADIWAVGALHRMKAEQIQVPQMVKVIGFDDQSFTELCNPSLSSVHQYPERLAENAVEALTGLIGKKSAVQMHGRVPVKLMCRESSMR